MTGVIIARTDWDFDRVPGYLRMTYRVVDEDGLPLAEGKDLAGAARRSCAPKTRAVVAAVGEGIEQRRPDVVDHRRRCRG